MKPCSILVALLWSALQAAGPGSVPRRDAKGSPPPQQAQDSEAEARFLKALEIDPQNADALNNLGVILRRRGDPIKAVELLRRAASLRPNDARIRSNLA